MTLIDSLRWVFAQTETTVVRECRVCGVELDEDDDQCPACGSDEVAEYRIE